MHIQPWVESVHSPVGDLKPEAMAIEGQSVRGGLASVELMGLWGVATRLLSKGS